VRCSAHALTSSQPCRRAGDRRVRQRPALPGMFAERAMPERDAVVPFQHAHQRRHLPHRALLFEALPHSGSPLAGVPQRGDVHAAQRGGLGVLAALLHRAGLSLPQRHLRGDRRVARGACLYCRTLKHRPAEAAIDGDALRAQHLARARGTPRPTGLRARCSGFALPRPLRCRAVPFV